MTSVISAPERSPDVTRPRRSPEKEDSGSKSGFRPEVQALRSAAVTAVVVYHLWPGRLTGGFVGVDVFFAISGFLITGHLLREVASAGYVNLLKFWGRRIRRLLPASLLVLAVSLVGVITLVPKLRWEQFLGEIVSSAAYFQNWQLAASSIRYGAENDAPSPVQHFWSLAVEEQFYLVWPIIITVVVLLVWKAPAKVKTIAIGVALLLAAVASFLFSVSFTASNPSEAYFVTGTRVWELAAGGLLAVASSLIGTAASRVPRIARLVVSVAGWVAIGFSTVTYNAQTVFPGSAALIPVAGALAVIAAGSDTGRANSVVRSEPVQFIGRTSYSIYLWHWPLMVFALAAGHITAGAFTTASKLILIFVTVLLAWATTNFVEDPVRKWAPLAAGPFWKTLTAMILAMAVIIVPATLIGRVAADQAAAGAQTAQDMIGGNRCYGAGTIDGKFDCSHEKFGQSIPDQNFADNDKADVYTDGCYTEITVAEVSSCVIGNPKSTIRVALIGDSHAANWYPALAAIAKQRGWALTPYLKSSCPMSAAVKSDPEPNVQASCTAYNSNLAALLTANKNPFDVVLVAHSSATGVHYGDVATTTAGFRAAWARLTAEGSKVVVIRDTPIMSDSTRACVIQTGGISGACAVPRKGAFLEDRMVTAAAGLDKVTILNMTDAFCTVKTCDPVIGGVTVYRDTNHVTATYMKTVTPYLLDHLLKVAPELR